jgi:hypothetical protein
MANKIIEFNSHTWTDFTFVEMNNFLIKFYNSYSGVVKRLGIFETDIEFKKYTLMEIINRVEKRRIYFKVFYNCVMSEENEIALFCYWITKLKPFTHKTEPLINDKIAVYYFILLLNSVAPRRGKKIILTDRLAKIISYDLRYRDILKEALMTLAESLLR